MRLLKLISFLFHPLHFPIAVVLFSFYFIPHTLNIHQERFILLFILISTYIIPLLFLYFLKKLNFIKSIYLKSANERKFPVLFLIFIFFIVSKIFFKLSNTLDLGIFFMANTLALALVFVFLYNQYKISLHTLGAGGLIGYLIMQSFYLQTNFISLLIPLFLLSGLIATIRLLLKAHSEKEIYLGFLIAVMSQIIIPITYSFLYRM